MVQPPYLAAPRSLLEVYVSQARGHLAAPRWQPAQIAEVAHEAGFRDLALVEATIVALAECDGFINSFNDNLDTIANCKAGQVVASSTVAPLVDGKRQPLPKFTILNPKTGQISLENGQSSLDPDDLVVVSRDCGIWEINIPAQAIGTINEEDLFNPLTNAQRAYRLMLEGGWGRWASVTSGIAFDDTYLLRGWLGAANFLSSGVFALRAQITDPARLPFHTLEKPIVTVPMLRHFYPQIPLG